jgi:hypothetical protein
MDLLNLFALFVYVGLCCMLVPVLIGFLSSIWQWIQEEWDKSRPRPDWRLRSKSTPSQSNNSAVCGPSAPSSTQHPTPPSCDPDSSAPGWRSKGSARSSPTSSSQIRRTGPPGATR